MNGFIVTNSKLLITSISFLLVTTFFSSAQANIITSVKPIGFITEAIAPNVTETDILLPDSASPHTYTLKPSDLIKLKSADLIIWVGKDMETFMPSVLKSVTEDKKIALMDDPAIKALLQTGHVAQHDTDHDHDHDHDHHGQYDEHIWLSPDIAKIIAQRIHDLLVAKYPAKKAIIDENLADFIVKVTETEQNIAKKLISVQNSGYFVFHDAYGYFESRFGLNHLGSFTINPAVQPGVQKIYEIQQQLKNHQAICVFKEPQFNPAVIDKLVDGTGVKVGELDPLGMGITLSKDAYPQFLYALAQQLLDCLDNK